MAQKLTVGDLEVLGALALGGAVVYLIYKAVGGISGLFGGDKPTTGQGDDANTRVLYGADAAKALGSSGLPQDYQPLDLSGTGFPGGHPSIPAQ